jgi:hypothetical protein
MTQLMYAPSDKLTPRDMLCHVPTPAAMGRSHSPYPFADYVDQVEDSLNGHGYVVNDQEYVVTADDQQFFGMMEIAPKHTFLDNRTESMPDWTIQVGLRGSHNQTLPRGLLLGSKVIVCSNLCFHGNIGQFKSKQTTALSARLPRLIQQCLSQVDDMVNVQDQAFDRMKNREIRIQNGDSALVQMYRRGAFTAAQLAKAADEWKAPSFDHGAPSVWRLMNAGTEALKPTGTNVNMALVEQRSQIVSNYCGLMAA